VAARRRFVVDADLLEADPTRQDRCSYFSQPASIADCSGVGFGKGLI
jgi:hypothetical protein